MGGIAAPDIDEFAAGTTQVHNQIQYPVYNPTELGFVGMPPKLSFVQVFSRLVVVGMLLVCYLQVGYLLADQPLTTVTSNKLYPVFEQKAFRRALLRIDQKQQIVLRGRPSTGLYLLLDFYTNKMIGQGYSVRKR